MMRYHRNLLLVLAVVVSGCGRDNAAPAAVCPKGVSSAALNMLWPLPNEEGDPVGAQRWVDARRAWLASEGVDECARIGITYWLDYVQRHIDDGIATRDALKTLPVFREPQPLNRR